METVVEYNQDCCALGLLNGVCNFSMLQVEHHPRLAKYAMENHSLREENRKLKLLAPVKRAHELDAQAIARLEQAFSEVSSTETNDKGKR